MTAPEIRIPPLARCAETGAREDWVSVNGSAIRYLTVGAGPPLVFIHGLFGYSFSWRFNFLAFARHFTVYAPDLPGVGFSERGPNPSYGLAALEQDVRQFLKQLSLRNPVLVGSSHGGAVAMMVAAPRDPEVSVPKLVLVSPVNPWSRQRAARAAFLGSRLGGTLLRCVAPLVPMTHAFFLRRMYGDPSRISPETLSGYNAALRVPGTLPHMLARVRHWNSDVELVRATLLKIAEVPTLLIWGSEDRAVPIASAYELKKNFKNAELAVVSGAGHLPYEEMPNEFNQLVLRFLAPPARGLAPGLATTASSSGNAAL